MADLEQDRWVHLIHPAPLQPLLGPSQGERGVFLWEGKNQARTVLACFCNRAVGGFVRITPSVLHLDAHHTTQMRHDSNESLVRSHRVREGNRNDADEVNK